MIALAAMSKNRIIGMNGRLPWNIKEDLQFFKNMTLRRKYCVVGRTTFETLPPLKSREILVITEDAKRIEPSAKGAFYDTIHPDAVYRMADYPHVCIGGGKTYELCLPHCTDLYLTFVKQVYEGDTVMPEFNHLFEVKDVLMSDPLFDIIHYTRKDEFEN